MAKKEAGRKRILSRFKSLAPEFTNQKVKLQRFTRVLVILGLEMQRDNLSMKKLYSPIRDLVTMIRINSKRGPKFLLMELGLGLRLELTCHHQSQSQDLEYMTRLLKDLT